jgi:hypothetical protein
MPPDNYRQAREKTQDCILQCSGADANAKWLTGIGSGDGDGCVQVQVMCAVCCVLCAVCAVRLWL